MNSCIKCGSTERYSSGACKVCVRVRVAQYKKDNPEKAAASVARWSAANPDKRKEYDAKTRARSVESRRIYNAKWNAENKERAKARKIEYRKNNVDRVKTAEKAYRDKNIAAEKARHAEYRAKSKRKITESSAIYYKKNKEKITANNAAWNAAHPESRRLRNHTRRAKETASGGKLSKGLTEKLFKLQRGKCACCGLPLGKNYHLDHRVPIARGGANEDSNMQLLRKYCNQTKSAKDPIKFMQSKGFLI